MLGIAAVVSLDLAFTVFIGSDNSANLADGIPINKPNFVRPTAPPTDQTPPEPPDSALVASLPSGAPRVSRVRTNLSARKALPILARQPVVTFEPRRYAPVPQPKRIVYVRAAARPTNETKPLSYGHYFVSVTDGVAPASSNSEIRRDRNNSLVSKMSPVVKKPWQWMKSVVSKLR